VRASTAAPIYFPREILQCDPNESRKRSLCGQRRHAAQQSGVPAVPDGHQRSLSPVAENGQKELAFGFGGYGAATTPTFKKKMNLARNALGLPGHLIYAIQVDQDINRRMGRCTYGSLIERELLDLTWRVWCLQPQGILLFQSRMLRRE